MELLDVISKDLALLKRFNIMDYSLLLAAGKQKTRRRSKLPQINEDDLTPLTNYRYINTLDCVNRNIYSLCIIDYLQ